MLIILVCKNRRKLFCRFFLERPRGQSKQGASMGDDEWWESNSILCVFFFSNWWLNKLMRRFYWSVCSKSIGMLLNIFDKYFKAWGQFYVTFTSVIKCSHCSTIVLGSEGTAVNYTSKRFIKLNFGSAIFCYGSWKCVVGVTIYHRCWNEYLTKTLLTLHLLSVHKFFGRLAAVLKINMMIR